VAPVTATMARENDESYRHPTQTHSMLATQLSELRAAMDAQNVLLARILERDAGDRARGES
jgi:hypothetical protein